MMLGGFGESVSSDSPETPPQAAAATATLSQHKRER